MTINWRRIGLLIGFLAAVVLLGYGLYYVFLRPTVEPGAIPTNTNTGTGNLPQAGTGTGGQTVTNVNGSLPGGGTGITQGELGPTGQPITPGASPVATGGLTQTKTLTRTKAYGAAISNDGVNPIYYDRTSGKFYRLAADGNAIAVSDQTFYNVENVTWASDKNRAVLEYPDGANIVYDFASKRQVTLPKHWEDFAWSPNGQQLAFKSMGSSNETRWLAIANSDGSGAKKIEALGDKDSTVFTNWSPTGQIVAMYVEDKDFDHQNLYFVGQNKENFRSVTVEGRGLQSQWSPSGNALLYSAYSSANNYRPSLWITGVSADGGNEQRVALNIETWASKCTFANNTTVYCAVPQSLPDGAGIFYKDLNESPTDIYKIDLATNSKTRIAIPEGNHNIETIMVADDEQNLYFTSKNDGRLYEIDLR